MSTVKCHLDLVGILVIPYFKKMLNGDTNINQDNNDYSLYITG